MPPRRPGRPTPPPPPPSPGGGGPPRRLRAAALLLDYRFYPRNRIDAVHVLDLLLARRAGETLPPVEVEAETNRIIDGFHRREAALKLDGDGALIDCVVRPRFPSDAEFFLAMVEANAHHGRKLSHQEQAKIILTAEELAIDPARIAGVLSLPPGRLDELRVTKVAISATTTTPIPVKRTGRHLAGKLVTARQEEALGRAGGLPALRYVNELLNILRGDLIDQSNATLLERLRELRDEIGAYLAAAGAPSRG